MRHERVPAEENLDDLDAPDDGDGAAAPAIAQQVSCTAWRSFMAETAYLSLVTGCCKAMIAIAVAQFGPALGSLFLACLYGGVIVSSLCIAGAIASTAGSKACLIGGCASYAVLFVAYFVAVLVPTLKWPSVLLGSLPGLMLCWAVWQSPR